MRWWKFEFEAVDGATRQTLKGLAMKNILCILLCLLTELCTIGALGMKENMIVLQNRSIKLEFDKETGAWKGFIDRKSGRELLAKNTSDLMAEHLWLPRLNTELISKALEDGRAITLTQGWKFTPDPPNGGISSGYLRDDFQTGDWISTPIPSELGVGDNRLHNRVGVFWYRTTFNLPNDWNDEDLTLVIGAVDDFDTTYVNGNEVGAIGDETPFNWETPRVYPVPAKLLYKNKPNTLLVKVTNGAFDGGITQGPVLIGLSSALNNPIMPGHKLDHFSEYREGSNSILDLTTHQGDFQYTLEYALLGDSSYVTRKLTISNISLHNVTLNGLDCVTPPIDLGSNQSVIFPGTLPVGDTLILSMSQRGALSARGEDPLAIVWDPKHQIGVGGWFDDEQEFSPVTVQRIGDGVTIQHKPRIEMILKPGDSVSPGVQYLWVTNGTRDAVLKGVQKVYSLIGLKAPSNHPPNLASKILYCGYPGGTPEMGFSGYGGFNAMDAYLPTLKKMGISLMWLLPTWYHGTDKKWNLYSPFDQFKVDPLLGTEKDLVKLGKDAKKDGIGLMFDLVPHGPPDFTPLAKDHPEWIEQNQDGTNRYAWGQYAFDYAQPGWENYMERAAEWDSKTFGAVGARVDCGAGGPPNWKPGLPYRPSFSTLGGGLAMNRAIRNGFVKVNGDAVLLPENYTGANVFYRYADLDYDAQFYYLMGDLQDKDATPEEWASDFEDFLNDQQLTLPPGALKMRWISNHDTVSWTFQKGRPAKIYGVPKMRALLALCAYIPGIPMLYQGDENPAVYGGEGVNNIPYITEIYGLRNRMPVLSVGKADYQSVKASGGVFCCLRSYGKKRALVLISFNPKAIKSALTFHTPMEGKWKDQLSGRTFEFKGEGSIEMSPYETRVLIRE